MGTNEREDLTIYRAVVNHEEQYAIWPVDRELPLGWSDAGKVGLKPEVLAWIEEVWTDMRPMSLRKKMEESERDRQGADIHAQPKRITIEEKIYRVVVTPDGQYAPWPVEWELRRGWVDTGMQGVAEDIIHQIISKILQKHP